MKIPPKETHHNVLHGCAVFAPPGRDAWQWEDSRLKGKSLTEKTGQCRLCSYPSRHHLCAVGSLLWKKKPQHPTRFPGSEATGKREKERVSATGTTREVRS